MANRLGARQHAAGANYTCLLHKVFENGGSSKWATKPHSPNCRIDDPFEDVEFDGPVPDADATVDQLSSHLYSIRDSARGERDWEHDS